MTRRSGNVLWGNRPPAAILPGAEPFTQDGDDTGVLVLHGFSGTPSSVRSLAQACAAAGFTVRVPLLPGHGTRGADLRRCGWSDWYAAVDREFEELSRHCSRVVVAGLSMGGSLALRLAQLRGAQIAAVIVVNPAVLSRDLRLKALPVLRWVLPVVPAVVGDIARPEVRELGYRWVSTRALASLVAAWPIVRRDLPRVQQPLLLFRSAEDHVVPAESSAAVLAGVSSTNITEVVLHHSFHVATLDYDAQLLAAEAVAFMRGLR